MDRSVQSEESQQSTAKSKLTSKDFVDPRKVKLLWQEAMYEASLQKGCLRIAWNRIPFIDPALYAFETKFHMNLVSLRLVGVQLETFPSEFVDHLFQIQVISFENNRIETLPDNIHKLTQLRELYLANNLLQELPERIGYLCNLQVLTLNNNKLQTLPLTFGALNLLSRIDLECNELRILPENFDNLTSCEVLNLNRNKLIRLPTSIGSMPSLTSLSACWNQLTQLPSELCRSRSLSILRVAVNKLRSLPERLGDLGGTLTEFTVEYNQLRQLPVSFHKLRRLQVFRVEGNEHVVDPPPEILTKGAPDVVQYCINQYFYDKEARMRHIVMSMQNIITQISERSVYDAAFFEPEVFQPFGDDNSEKDPDAWCALQLSYFWQTLVPKMKAIWQAQQTQNIYSDQTSFYTMETSSDNVTDFEFTEREVMWAFTHYADAVGPVLRRQPACFRRCACVDASTGLPKPCVPPKVGYMCRRSAVWIKRRLVRQRDQTERKWQTYKLEHESDAVRRAEMEAKQYLESKAGQRWLDETACEQAEDMLLEQGVDKIVQRRIAKTDKAKTKVIKRYDAKMARIQRLRDNKLQKMQDEVNALKDQYKFAREGYLKDVLENKIEVIAQEMAVIPEIEQLANLQRQCAQEIDALEEELYRGVDDDDEDITDQKKKQKKKKMSDKAGSSGSSAEDSDGPGSKAQNDDDDSDVARAKAAEEEEDDLIACLDTDELREVVAQDRAELASHQQEYDSDDSCPEAKRYRRMRIKRIKRLQRLEAQEALRREEFEHMEKQIKSLQHEAIDREHGSSTQPHKSSYRLAIDTLLLQTSYNTRKILQTLEESKAYEDIYKPMRRVLRKQRVMMRKQLRDVVEISKIRAGKVLRRLNGDFNEVCRELTYEIKRQYVTHAMQQARKMVQHEFSVIERVRNKMSGASLETTFLAWKRFVWTKQQRTRQDQRRQYKRAVKHYETAMESVRSAELQVAMWHHQRDIYSDRDYWQHQRTGDITYDVPTIYHYLPWNFTIPTLPEELPSDVSLNTTDDSDFELTTDQLNKDPSAVLSNSLFKQEHQSAIANAVQDALNEKQEAEAARKRHQKQQRQEQQQSKEKKDTTKSPLTPAEQLQRQQELLLQQQQQAIAATTTATSGDGSGAPKRNIHQELLQWQAKYGQRRRAAWEEDEKKRALRRERRQRMHRSAPVPTNVLLEDAAQALAIQQRRSPSGRLGRSSKGLSNDPWQEQPSELSQSSSVHFREPFEASTDSFAFHATDQQQQQPSSIYYPSTAKHSSVTAASTDHHPNHQRYLTPLELTLQTLKLQKNALLQESQDISNGGGPLLAFDTSDLVKPLSERVHESATHLEKKSLEEFEAAYKIIRRKRNQLNPTRHHLYLSHVNRKPRSMEMLREESAAEEAKHFIEVEPGVIVDDRKIDFVHPSDEELLRLAGGDLEMVNTGKEGLELRSVLAQRALHIKESLRAKAIEKGLLDRSKDHNTFYRRELKPLFMHRYEGSDSDESDDDDEAHALQRAAAAEGLETGDEDGESGGGVGGWLGMLGLGGKKKEKQQTPRSTGAVALFHPKESKRVRAKRRQLHRQMKEERHKERERHEKVQGGGSDGDEDD